MNQTKKQKERHAVVLELVARWQDRLQLDHYRLQVTPWPEDEYQREPERNRWAEVNMCELSFQAHICYLQGLDFD